MDGSREAERWSSGEAELSVRDTERKQSRKDHYQGQPQPSVSGGSWELQQQTCADPCVQCLLSGRCHCWW